MNSGTAFNTNRLSNGGVSWDVPLGVQINVFMNAANLSRGSFCGHAFTKVGGL